jgi:hypothetical protein
MGNFRVAVALLCSLLAGTVRAGRAEAPPAGARELVRAVDAALAGVAQAAGDPKSGLDRGSPKAAAFWNALDALRVHVSRIGGSLDRRDGEFFLLVDQGSSTLGELRVDWARTGARNAGIAGEIRVASVAYRTLRSVYGREGLRQRQGGTLSDAERRQFQRLQRTERRFAASLRLLQDQARRHGAAVTAAELERFRAEAERIAWAPLDLGAYLNALIANSELRGEWSADAPYVRKDAPAQQVAAADATVQDLYVDSDIGQVFAANLGPAAGEAADGSAPAPGAVQVFQVSDQASEGTAAAAPVDSEDPAEPAAAEPAAAEAEPAVEPAGGVVAGEDMAEAAQADPEVAAPAVPVGAQHAAPKPADPTPVAVPPIPPPIG